jgi:hypothetical protein
MSFWTLTPRRILWDVVAIAEVIVSIVVHLSYGLSIFGMDRCHEYSFSQQQQHLTTK